MDDELRQLRVRLFSLLQKLRVGSQVAQSSSQVSDPHYSSDIPSKKIKVDLTVCEDEDERTVAQEPNVLSTPLKGTTIDKSAEPPNVAEDHLVPRGFRVENAGSVGPSGGILETANFKITVPQNAMKDSLRITVKEMSPFKYLPTPMLRLIHKQSIDVGPLLIVLPHDTSFERPVSILSSYIYECVEKIDCRLVRPMLFRCSRLGETWTDVSNEASIKWQSENLSFNLSRFSVYLTVLLRIPNAWLQTDTLLNYQNNVVQRPMFQLWHLCDSSLERENCLLTIATPEQQVEARDSAKEMGYHEISQESRPLPFVVSGSTLVVTSSCNPNKCNTVVYDPETFQLVLFATALESDIRIGFQDGHDSDNSGYIQLDLFEASPQCPKPLRAATNYPPGGSEPSAKTSTVSEAAEVDSSEGGKTYDFGMLVLETEDIRPLWESIAEMLDLSGFRAYVSTMKRLGKFRIKDVSESFEHCKNFIVLQGSESTDLFKAYLEMIMVAVAETNRVCCMIQYTSTPFYTQYTRLGCCQIVDVSEHAVRDGAGLLQLSTTGKELVRTNVASIYKYRKTDFVLPVRLSHNLLHSSRMNKSVLILGERPTTDKLITELSRVGYKTTTFKSIRETANELLDVRAVICPKMRDLPTMELLALYSVCHHDPGIISVDPSRLENLEVSSLHAVLHELVSVDQLSMNGFSIGAEDTLLKALLVTDSDLTGLPTSTRDIVTALAANGHFKDTFKELMTLLRHHMKQQFCFTALWSLLELEEPEYFKLLPALHTNHGKLLLLAADIVDKGLQRPVVMETLQMKLSEGMATLFISKEGTMLRQNFDTFESTKQRGLVAFALDDMAISLNAMQDRPIRRTNWIPSLYWTLDNVDCTVSERYMLQDLLKSNVTVPDHYRLKAAALILTFIDRLYCSKVSVFDRPLACPGLHIPQHSQQHCSSIDTAVEMLCKIAEINMAGSSASFTESTDLSASLAKREIIQKRLWSFYSNEPRLMIIIHKVFQHCQISTGTWKTRDLALVCEMMDILNQSGGACLWPFQNSILSKCSKRT